MKTQVTTSLDKFLIQQRTYQISLELFRRLGAPELLIVKLERDMARSACKFLLTHTFPALNPRNGENKPKARRVQTRTGSGHAKQSASKKGN